VNDRLGDLTPDFRADDDDLEKGESSEGDFELVEAAKEEDTGTEFMDQFFQDVASVKEDIEAIKEATKRIGEMNEEALMATSDRDEADLSNEMRPLIDETNKRAKRTKNILSLLKEENEKLKKKNVKPSDLRIRQNLCNTLTRKFVDEIKQYQNAQQKYKTDLRKKAARQIKVIKPDATEEEVDVIMKTDGGREALYKETILSGGVNDNIKTAYANVAGKYQDVLALEQSVAELHQLFQDFALLTDQQGELLDQIEFNVKEAADHIEDANVEVFESIELQKSIRKKQCCIIIIVVVCVIIVMFIAGVFR